MKKIIKTTLVFLCLFSFFISFGQDKELIILRSQEQYHKLTGDKWSKKYDNYLLNTKATDFTFRPLKGDSVQLSKLRGKVVFMNVFHTLCIQCILEMPLINKLAEQYKNKDVVFLAMSPHDIPKGIYQMQKRLEKRGRVGKFHDNVKVIPASFFGKIGDGFTEEPKQQSKDFNNVVKPMLDKNYKVVAFPYSIFIDKKGVIRFISYGYQDKKYNYYPLYTNTIDKLLAEKK